MRIVIDLLIYILLALILLVSCSRDKTFNQANILQRLNNMRGIFAIEIVIGHVIRYENSLLYPLGKFMIISVAFFFFVSAWGMSRSYKLKEDYLNGFLVVKISHIMVLIVVAFLLGICVDLLVPAELGYWDSGDRFMHSIFVMTNWYLWELLCFYILFYLCYKYMYHKAPFIITIVTLSAVIVLFIMNWSQMWYASALAFPMGLLWERYYEKMSPFLNSYKGYFTTFMLVGLGLFGLLMSEESIVGMVFLRNVICIAGIGILLYFCQWIEVKNRALQWLNKYSTEIYLFQFPWLFVAEEMQCSYIIKMVLVVALTLLSAMLFHPLIAYTKNRLKSKLVKS